MPNDYSVYMHITPNNKYYIGITRQYPVEKRWKNGLGYKSQYFYRAIQKYGWDNIKHIIVANKLTCDEAKQMEQQLIVKHKSNFREYGYNLTSGGDNHDCPVTEETRLKIKLGNSTPIYQFDMDYNFIKEYSGIREAQKELGLSSKSGIIQSCSLQLVSSYGYIWRYKKDVIDPMDKSCIPKRLEKRIQKPIYQINIQTREYIIWENISSAVEKTGFNYQDIYSCCKNRIKSYHGYKWKFCDDIINIEKYILDDNNFKNTNGKSVYQYDLNNNLIQFFTSISEASRILHLNRKSIARACNDDIGYYGGFIWKYA